MLSSSDARFCGRLQAQEKFLWPFAPYVTLQKCLISARNTQWWCCSAVHVWQRMHPTLVWSEKDPALATLTNTKSKDEKTSKASQLEEFLVETGCFLKSKESEQASLLMGSRKFKNTLLNSDGMSPTLKGLPTQRELEMCTEAFDRQSQRSFHGSFQSWCGNMNEN